MCVLRDTATAANQTPAQARRRRGRSYGIDTQRPHLLGSAPAARVGVGLVAAATLLGAIALDQTTKAWADTRAGTAVLHNGAALLGIVDGPAVMLITVTVAVLVAFGLVVVPIAFRFGVPAWVPALVLGGATSNLIDRARLGEVRDFITTPWAVVNLADLCVLAGVVLLPVLVVLHHARHHPTTAASVEARSRASW